MTIELTGKHAALFGVLFVAQVTGFWISLTRSPYLQGFVHHAGLGWLTGLILLCAGSTFLATVIVLELVGAIAKPQ